VRRALKLRPDWDIPGVDAGFTLRTGGVSKPPYDSLNLAMHVDDDPDDVRENRRRLVEHAGLPEELRWLKQVHGNRVVQASEVERDVTEADAVWTDQPGQIFAVLEGVTSRVVIRGDLMPTGLEHIVTLITRLRMGPRLMAHQ
jgi:copper oxidase (laccase) domain-containing protein